MRALLRCASRRVVRRFAAREWIAGGVFVLGMLASAVAPAQVVKCVDAKGRVEYAKTCPAGTKEASRIQRDVPPEAPTPDRAGPAATGRATAIETGPDQLDGAEDNVCGASSRLAGARAGLAEKDTLPVEQLAGPIDDPRRREFLQQKLDAGLESAQKSIVASQANDLARYQSEYKRMTGAEFNVALCGDTQRRIKRREAWESRRREEALQKHADLVVSSEGDGIRAICREKETMDGPPKDRAQAFTAEQLKDIQDGGRAAYVRLVASYERSHHKRFEPALCR